MLGALVSADLSRSDEDLAAERDLLRARIKAMPRRTELRRELEARARDLTSLLLDRYVARGKQAAANDDTGLNWWQK